LAAFQKYYTPMHGQHNVQFVGVRLGLRDS
jgi:hypothetical protein